MAAFDGFTSLMMRWFPFSFVDAATDLWTPAAAYECFSKHNGVLNTRNFEFKASYSLQESKNNSPEFLDQVGKWCSLYSQRPAVHEDESSEQGPLAEQKTREFAEFLSHDVPSNCIFVSGHRQVCVHRTWFRQAYGYYPPQAVTTDAWVPLATSGKTVILKRKRLFEFLCLAKDVENLIADYYFNDGFSDPYLLWVWRRPLVGPTGLASFDCALSCTDFLINSWIEVLRTSIKGESCTRNGDFQPLQITHVTFECNKVSTCTTHLRTLTVCPQLTSVSFSDNSQESTTLNSDQLFDLSRGRLKAGRYLFTMLAMRVPFHLFLCSEGIHFA